MYKFLNLHPQGKSVGDCVKRAIAGAEQRDYKEVSLELNRLKKESKVSKFNDMKNVRLYMKKHGYKKLSFPAEKGKPRMNGERFCKSYKNGKYILRMAGYLTCCINGIIYDTWDCTDKCVYNAWVVE